MKITTLLHWYFEQLSSIRQLKISSQIRTPLQSLQCRDCVMLKMIHSIKLKHSTSGSIVLLAMFLFYCGFSGDPEEWLRRRSLKRTQVFLARLFPTA